MSSDSEDDSDIKTKKKAKSKNKKFTFHMPKTLYDETMEEIEGLKPLKLATGDEKYFKSCHSTSTETFNSGNATLSTAHILEALHQAYEDKNFSAVYQFIEFGFEFEEKLFLNHLTEHLLLSIEADPAIPNREEFLLSTLKGLTGRSDCHSIKEFHQLKKRKLAKDDESSSDDED